MIEIKEEITTAEEIIVALKDAVELEMSLMLQYLYAAYSIPNLVSGQEYVKRGIWKPEHLKFMCGDGEERMNQGIRGVILRIAREEMIHFLMANNLLMAVGGSFHTCTPDFSKLSKFYPLGVEMALEPFSENCVKRFIYFEWPSYYQDRTVPGHSNNGKTTYSSVSQLYQKIRIALVNNPELILVEKNKTGGEHHLFLNKKTNTHHPNYQCQVDDLDSALFTIDLITEQGEGANAQVEVFEDSHFHKFQKIHHYLQEFNLQGDWFHAYPTLRNPSIARRPGTNQVLNEETAEVMQIFNGCFEISMQMMVQHFGKRPTESLRMSRLMNTSLEIMAVLLRPLAILLMTLESGIPGRTAGPSFELSQPIQYIPYDKTAQKLLVYKFEKLYAKAQKLKVVPDTIQELLQFFIGFTQNID
ncbi:MAG: ferritin-like protein [Mojavia pulchra JT2-VF2]|jgi:hypothetical protein|uniref:Ferritin-like protein n=1 Tax=Mojavia pulchra JT2-VF2 TaxID=287848 RepID=A0A951UGZ5_9NOST|nr:ferritin-like protein [Mojavia pulchra JT2-VF2]